MMEVKGSRNRWIENAGLDLSKLLRMGYTTQLREEEITKWIENLVDISIYDQKESIL